MFYWYICSCGLRWWYCVHVITRPHVSCFSLCGIWCQENENSMWPYYYFVICLTDQYILVWLHYTMCCAGLISAGNSEVCGACVRWRHRCARRVVSCTCVTSRSAHRDVKCSQTCRWYPIGRHPACGCGCCCFDGLDLRCAVLWLAIYVVDKRTSRTPLAVSRWRHNA